MRYLLDTNVISEIVKTKPNTNALNWLSTIPNSYFFLSVLTIGAIRTGIEKISDKKRKQKLLLWLEQDLVQMFKSRILPIDFEVAERWGRLRAEAKQSLAAVDSLIAATALHYDMTLVTRNISDFVGYPSLQLINPWES